MLQKRIGRLSANHGKLDPHQLPQIYALLPKQGKKQLHTISAGKHDPLVAAKLF